MKIQEINPPAFNKLSYEFQTYIDDNITGCVVCAIYHQDKLAYCNKFGWKDKENQIPIQFDDIFTKPSIKQVKIFFIATFFAIDYPLYVKIISNQYNVISFKN